MMTSMSDARAAKEVIKHLLAGVEGISGIGITWDDQDTPVILITVNKSVTARVKSILAKQPLDIPVLIEEMGAITAEL